MEYLYLYFDTKNGDHVFRLNRQQTEELKKLLEIALSYCDKEVIIQQKAAYLANLSETPEEDVFFEGWENHILGDG